MLTIDVKPCYNFIFNRKDTMARVRNNQGHRNKILNIFMRPYLEQELTQEKEAFDQARETIKPLQDKTWQLAKNIVGRFYTPKDVEMA